MLKRREALFCTVAALTLAAAAGCGGGGSHATPSSPVVPAASSGGSGGATNASSTNLTLSIKIPRGVKGPSSGKRSAQYISSATESLTATLTPGASGTTNCSGSVCSITIGATVGSPTLVVNLYDGPNGTGNLLSTVTQSVTILANTANSVNLSFNGVVTQLGIQQGPTNDDTPPVYLQPGTFAVDVIPEDADGWRVVSPGVLLDPTLMAFGTFTNGSTPNVALSTSDETITAVSPVTYNSTTGYFESYLTYAGGSAPSAPITMALTGGSIGSGITLNSLSGGALTFTPQILYYSAMTVPPNPNFYNSYLDPGPDGYTTNAYTDSYIEVPNPVPSAGDTIPITATLNENYAVNTALSMGTDTCNGSYTDGTESSNLPSEIMGSAVTWTFNITSTTNGYCYFVVSDTQGNSAELDIDINQGSLLIEHHNRKGHAK